MKLLRCGLLGVVLAAGPARADDAAPAPKAPPTFGEVIDRVMAAVAAKDGASLSALAAGDNPDPWVVAERLMALGASDAAAAFARAAPRPDVAALPAYVEARRGRPSEPGDWSRMAAAEEAWAAGRLADVVEAAGPADPAPPQDVVGVTLVGWRGYVRWRERRPQEAATAFRLAAEGAERIGWIARASVTYGQAAAATIPTSHAAARPLYARSVAMWERRGDVRGAAVARLGLGTAHFYAGDYDEALDAWEKACAGADAVGDAVTRRSALANLGNVFLARGDLARTQATYERALAECVAAGDDALADQARDGLASLHRHRGDFGRAAEMHEAVVAGRRARGDVDGALSALHNLALVHLAQGDFPRALAELEQVVEQREAAGQVTLAAAARGNLGHVLDLLGDRDRALDAYERALAVLEEAGRRAECSAMLSSIGDIHLRRGDLEEALAFYQRSLVLAESVGDRSGAATTRNNLGIALWRLGRNAQALEVLGRVRDEKEAAGDRRGLAATLDSLGAVLQSTSDLDGAAAVHARALALNDEIGDRHGSIISLRNLASVRGARGDWVGVLEAVRRAVALLPLLSRGLGDEQGAVGRAEHAPVFEHGIRAAVALGDVATAAEIIERGRARSLLEALGSRVVLGEHALPEQLVALEARTRLREARAAQALRAASSTGDRAAIRARRQELVAAEAEVLAAVARIQREAKAAADVVEFAPDALGTIQSRLAPAETLVLYAWIEPAPVALVVTSAMARIVRLGPTAELAPACEALAVASTTPADPDAVVRAAATFDRLAVTPLRLPTTTRRLLVALDGPLAYAPLSLLLPDAEIVQVPSATTYGVLLGEATRRGEGVLALGDPDYEAGADARGSAARGRAAEAPLVRLPGTRDEARAVGQTVLLGREATERGLRDALRARPRWRAVHFACHGLFDAEQPAFSALALTAGDGADGFLTVHEVFRSTIPADLVVLSACETAKGKAVRGEGILGLARAFMSAGAPRVLCSLWRVDDEATTALMIKFYELWNPRAQPEDPERAKRVEGAPGSGLPTAEALREAQAFVRSHEKWKHPYYWAAWVLWGLP